MVPWLKKISEHAANEEDKLLPLIAQHWARISRTLQGKFDYILSHYYPILNICCVHFLGILSDVEKEWFVEYYYRLASLGSAHQAVKEKTNVFVL